jgi:hypothetical protein
LLEDLYDQDVAYEEELSEKERVESFLAHVEFEIASEAEEKLESLVFHGKTSGEESLVYILYVCI